MMAASIASSQKNPRTNCRFHPGIPLFYPQEGLKTALIPKAVFTNFSGRSSDSWIFLLAAPSQPVRSVVFIAAFVPIYSGGPVPDFHRVPFFSLYKAPEKLMLMFLYYLWLLPQGCFSGNDSGHFPDVTARYSRIRQIPPCLSGPYGIEYRLLKEWISRNPLHRRPCHFWHDLRPRT
jgi:hypothetical protein